MSSQPSILRIYNADTGLFNLMADIGHKMFSPQTCSCDLCALTRAYFSERGRWRAFIEQLDCECDFLYRDEFIARYPEAKAQLPAVFNIDPAGIRCCVDAEAIAGCKDLDALQTLITERCCGGKSN